MLLSAGDGSFKPYIIFIYILSRNKNFSLFFFSCDCPFSVALRRMKLYNRNAMKELLRKLIQAETTAQKGELAAAEIISDEFGRSGIDCQIDNWGLNRANLAAQIKSGGRKSGLLFVCHLDVVAAGQMSWKHPAFAGVESEGRIYGRGSADMRGGIASAVTAIREIVDSGVRLEGDIIFFAAAGEETDSCGTRRFISSFGSKLPQIAGVVIPEPTDFEVVTAHRGMLWLEVRTEGSAAHSSTPELGVNAIASMKTLLAELDNYKIRFKPHKRLGNCSMSVNTIAGGKEINVVPDQCSIGMDIRTLPGQQSQQIISDFEKIFAKLKQKNSQFEASVSVMREVGALETDSQCDFVKDFCSAVEANETKAVGFTTDGPHFASLGAPVVIFGPGKPQLAHKPDEYIDIADVEKAVEYYKNIILKFLT
jgi:succinyl-diaminopimelate desuccinylase